MPVHSNMLCSLLCACLYITSVEGISCWKCNSVHDRSCGDPFNNQTSYQVDCDQQNQRQHLPNVKFTMCRKIRQKILGEWRVIRDCAAVGPLIDERYCTHIASSPHVYVENCLCASKDGCNGADARQTSISTICQLTLAVVAVLLLAG